MTSKVKQINSRSGSRTYDVDGEIYPSVTTIIETINKPALVGWSAKLEREAVIEAAAELEQSLPINAPTMMKAAYVATLQSRLPKKKAWQSVKEESTDIGSKIHHAVEWYLRDELGQAQGSAPDILDDRVHVALQGYRHWKDLAKFKVQHIEQVVYSESYGYAGTMDWSGWTTTEHGEGFTVGDWKSGKALYRESIMQVSAYAHALIEMGHAEPPIRGCVVRLPKAKGDEPECLMVEWPAMQDGFIAFLGLKRAYEWLQVGNRKQTI